MKKESAWIDVVSHLLVLYLFQKNSLDRSCSRAPIPPNIMNAWHFRDALCSLSIYHTKSYAIYNSSISHHLFHQRFAFSLPKFYFCCCCFWKTAAETTNNNNKSIVATTKLQLLSGKICWIFLCSIGFLCVQTVCVGAHWIVKRKSSALNRLFSQSVVVVHDDIEKRKKPAYLTLPNWMEMCVIRITMKQKSPSSSYCLHFPLLLSTCFNQNQAYLFVGDVVVVFIYPMRANVCHLL